MITRFIDVASVATRCLLAGAETAPPLLLLHGLSLTSEIWIRNIDALGRDFRVVAVDLLGHGFTRPRDGAPAGIEDKLVHLEALIDVLGFGRLSISGSSYGGLMAANLALRRRELVDRLVINGSGSAFNTEAQLASFMERIQAGYRPTLGETSPDGWRARLAGTVFDARSLPCELLAVLPLCYAQPWAVPCWDETVDTMRRPERFRPFRILDRLEELDLPTLVVWGREDKGGIYESAVAAVARMPQAALVAFEACGHLPMMECPEQYNAVVRDFLLPLQRGEAARA
jgi:2-hydroxy-6-oxo-6-(2'-carboxyphenyl)-hexa-2,4-dienoate hydrolase